MKKGLLIIAAVLCTLTVEIVLIGIYWEIGYKKGVDDCEHRLKVLDRDREIEMGVEDPPIYNFSKYD